MRYLAFLLALLLAPWAAAQSFPPSPAVAAKAWVVVDHTSGLALAGQGADERVEPASLTKLMTAYLTFAALKEGKIKADQVVPVSERAWRAQGSRMFIDPKQSVTVSELIRGMIVQSGNDACVALAEAIAGSEETFVHMMNQEAGRMGLANTHFMNATGMPDPQHYTTANDLAKLARAVIRDFPDQSPIYSTKEYTYNKTTHPNRNRLLWLDPTVDGVKTGHTESAGFCLIASAKRGARRLTSVVLGTASDAVRAQESLKLLNFGFQAFDAVKLYDKNQAVSNLKVFKGSLNTVKAGFAEDFVLSLPKGMADKIKVQLVSRQPLMAPVQQGQQVATLKLTVDGKPWG
ncbi:MAG: D-alanyl-D-alanine carboxypeptidase, partial [Rhodocyclaceae bacterium]|nr:D-alanyl-D-alanine carboxypeptidase [Rhodocyclaceae bacterium]